MAKVGACLVNGGVHGEGVTCMVKRGRGVCVVNGGSCMVKGACVAGGVHGQGGMRVQGACVAGETATAASYWNANLLNIELL